MLREAAAYASRPPTSRPRCAGPALSMLAVSYCFDLQSTLVIEDT